MFGKKQDSEIDAKVKLDFASLQARIAVRKAENEAAEQRKLESFQYADDEDRVAAKTYVPEVEVLSGSTTKYLCCLGVEVPAAYVEKIGVAYAGSAPKMDFSLLGYRPIYASLLYDMSEDRYVEQSAKLGYFATPAVKAMISITTVSGQVHQIEVSRHRADATVAALIRAWRESR